MATTVTYGRGKEIGAVIYNLKEQRCLEKTLKTIDIQQSYSLKLLELNHRIIKVNHRKLKDRVCRIRSNLNADDIVNFREQEAAGLLKATTNCLNLGSARKIAAASRRLNIRFEKTTSCNSPRYPPDSTVLMFKHRPHSVSGACIDVPNQTSKNCRRHLSNCSVNLDPGVNGSESSKTSTEPAEYTALSNLIPRPHTTGAAHGIQSEKLYTPHILPTLTNIPARSTTQLSTHSHGQSNSVFSSHIALENGLRTPSNISRSASIRGISGLLDDSIESNLGDDIYEERRQDMLNIEAINAAILEKRKDAFIQDVNDYIDEVRIASTKNKDPKIEVIRKNSEESNSGQTRIDRNSRRRVEFDGIPTSMPQDAYTDRLMQLWKGMNTCRYLRIPDEVLDLSGVATLAKHQLQLGCLWKNYSHSPIN